MKNKITEEEMQVAAKYMKKSCILTVTNYISLCPITEVTQ